MLTDLFRKTKAKEASDLTGLHRQSYSILLSCVLFHNPSRSHGHRGMNVLPHGNIRRLNGSLDRKQQYATHGTHTIVVVIGVLYWIYT